MEPKLIKKKKEELQSVQFGGAVEHRGGAELGGTAGQRGVEGWGGLDVYSGALSPQQIKIISQTDS